jgi:hypothetical protein
MAWRIEGLAPQRFAPLFAMDDEALGVLDARRLTAGEGGGYPCRVSLEEAKAGESLILLNHVSLDVPTPFRTAYAIYVRETAGEAARYVDKVPPMIAARTLGLRGFDAEGMLRSARLCAPGKAGEEIAALFGDEAVARIHAHNAAYGCFLAEIVRD